MSPAKKLFRQYYPFYKYTPNGIKRLDKREVLAFGKIDTRFFLLVVIIIIVVILLRQAAVDLRALNAGVDVLVKHRVGEAGGDEAAEREAEDEVVREQEHQHPRLKRQQENHGEQHRRDAVQQSNAQLPGSRPTARIKLLRMMVRKFI